MSNRIFGTQPSGPLRINTAHKAVQRGLSLAWRAGDSNKVFYNGQWTQTDNQGPMAIESRPRGGMSLRATSASYRNNLIADSALLPTTAITVVYIQTKLGANATQHSFLTGSSTSIINCHAPWSDGTFYWDFGGQSGANRLSVAGLTYGYDVFVMTAGPRGMEITQNAIPRAGQGTAVSRVASSGVLTLQNTSFADTNVYVHGLIMFPWQATFGEACELCQDPWGVFAPPVRKMWDVGAAAGGFKAAWAVNANSYHSQGASHAA